MPGTEESALPPCFDLTQNRTDTGSKTITERKQLIPQFKRRDWKVITNTITITTHTSLKIDAYWQKELFMADLRCFISKRQLYISRVIPEMPDPLEHSKALN